MDEEMITKKTYKALAIIRDNDCITAYSFAEKMWPDSSYWRKSYNTGSNGACKGKGMWLCAGSYLHKLSYKGYITILYCDFKANTGWSIKREGLDTIKEFEKNKKLK